jgi:hypothetical protein
MHIDGKIEEPLLSAHEQNKRLTQYIIEGQSCRIVLDLLVLIVLIHALFLKIANGFLSTWSLFVALLELCEVGNVSKFGLFF